MSPPVFINLATEADTLQLGAAVCRAARPKQIIYLRGDLGAGKTTFSRGFICASGYSGVVKSPTYTLVELYEDNALSIAHFDLYRLTEVQELDYLGLDEWLAGEYVFLIEWPEILGAGMLPPDLQIELSYDGDARVAQINGELAQEVLANYKNDS